MGLCHDKEVCHEKVTYAIRLAYVYARLHEGSRAENTYLFWYKSYGIG